MDIEQVKTRFKEVGVFDLFGTKKEVKELPKIIQDNETILYACSGFLDGNTYLITATDRRLIFLDKGMIYGLKQTEIPLDKINSISFSKGIVLGKLVVFDGASKMEISQINKNAVAKFAGILKDAAEKFTHKQNSNDHPTQVQAPAKEKDLVEEIRRYKSLADEGIISTEEFEAKKKQLLGL